MQDPLSLTLSALADPTRRAILARLAQGDASVNELAAPFAISQPAISKHLKVLEQAGLISRARKAQLRPCRLEAAPLRDLAGWLESYRRFWDQSFDRLDVYLKELQKGNPDGPRN
ncbi:MULTISPECIES: helix-turn-helix transcriptional regulator [Methylocystis]|uniref:ArsR/SmtB family transcription factor n=1 Tax=Methylocystis TaxID=133 RepID=UPI001921A9AC|nr:MULTISPECIES: metalloregulator ArsR/SmtB family transcription factor [Methylocystis]MBL1255303.1 helix-turn-helix transcriptional regulator [Methylocystis sp. Sn-Cys]MDJ0449588.1 metalloregulator ArsR/SmtB family transcription factor [Methylocystis sp. JR02]